MMKIERADMGLECLLRALEQEVLDASDAEIIAVAHELGMKPELKGSSAFFGVTMLSHYGMATHGEPMPNMSVLKRDVFKTE